MKDQSIYLKHILESINVIELYTSSGSNVFLRGRMRQDAVIRRLEVIGEAVKHLAPDIKESRPDIPWREISALPDKLLHEYFGVNLRLVWAVLERDLPDLKAAVQSLLRKL